MKKVQFIPQKGVFRHFTRGCLNNFSGSKLPNPHFQYYQLYADYSCTLFVIDGHIFADMQEFFLFLLIGLLNIFPHNSLR